MRRALSESCFIEISDKGFCSLIRPLFGQICFNVRSYGAFLRSSYGVALIIEFVYISDSLDPEVPCVEHFLSKLFSIRKGIKYEKHPSDPHRVSFFITLSAEQRLVQHVIEEFFCQLQLLSAEALKPYLFD